MKQGILCRYSQVEHSPGLKEQAELSQQQEGGREPLVLDLQIWTEFKPLINHIIHLSVLIPSTVLGKLGLFICVVFARVLPSRESYPEQAAPLEAMLTGHTELLHRNWLKWSCPPGAKLLWSWDVKPTDICQRFGRSAFWSQAWAGQAKREKFWIPWESQTAMAMLSLG